MKLVVIITVFLLIFNIEQAVDGRAIADTTISDNSTPRNGDGMAIIGTGCPRGYILKRGKCKITVTSTTKKS